MDVTHCTPNDVPQKMGVYYPSSSGPWPVLVYIHGGGWNESDKAEGIGLRGMNERGFLVISVNYRLAAYDNKFPVMIKDVKCAIRYLRPCSRIQPRRESLEQSQVFDEQLKKAGVPSMLMIVKNGPHSLQGNDLSPILKEIPDMIIAFLEKQLR